MLRDRSGETEPGLVASGQETERVYSYKPRSPHGGYLSLLVAVISLSLFVPNQAAFNVLSVSKYRC